MAVNAFWYPKGMQGLISDTAAWDWDTDDVSGTIMVALLNSSHTFTPDTHDFFNDVSANEIAGTGYNAAGTPVAGRSVNHDTGGTLQLRANNTAWTGASFTARHAVVYKRVPGGPSSSPLLFSIDFGGDETVSSGTFTLDWDDVAGIATIAFPGT